MGKYRKQPLRVPLSVIVALCTLLGAALGYYLKPTPELPMRTMTIASQNKAVVATVNSASVFISDVRTEGAITTVTMSNGDKFIVNDMDLSLSPKVDLNLQCSDAIIVTPELAVMTCRGKDYDLNYAWNRQP